MPWQELSILSQRYEFVRLAQQDGVCFRELCRRFEISATTGYKWLDRFTASPSGDLNNLSKRPHTSPQKTSESIEDLILSLREQRPTWGGRKLAARLIALGHQDVPAPSTITAILKRHKVIDPTPEKAHLFHTRFEYDRPNDLWQMDFKGHFALTEGRCHPLTILDDHSRFSVTVRACTNELGDTVKSELISCFRVYGLPTKMLMDNGGSWGRVQGITAIEAWLMRLNIRPIHGRPYHPQTQGKEERFHRTLKADVLQFRVPDTLAGCQKAFDEFRHIYNHERPHESIGMQTPISRYTPSSRSYPEVLPEVEHAPGDIVRKVASPGYIHFHNCRYRIGGGVIGQYVGLRPTLEDGIYNVVFCSMIIRQIDIRTQEADPS